MVSPTPTLRSSQTQARRAQILAAALDLLRELGPDGVTVEALRERSGASVGSIYHHFGNLDGVLGELYQAGLDDYRAGLMTALQSARSAKAKVRAFVEHYLRWSEDNPAWAKFLLQERHRSGVQQAEPDIRRSTDGFVRKVREHFAPYISSGEILRMPPEAYAAILAGPAENVVRHWLAGRSHMPPSELANTLGDAAWRALSQPPQNPPRSS